MSRPKWIYVVYSIWGLGNVIKNSVIIKDFIEICLNGKIFPPYLVLGLIISYMFKSILQFLINESDSLDQESSSAVLINVIKNWAKYSMVIVKKKTDSQISLDMI